MVLYFTRDGFVSAGPERIKRLLATGIQLIAADADEWDAVYADLLGRTRPAGAIA